MTRTAALWWFSRAENRDLSYIVQQQWGITPPSFATAESAFEPYRYIPLRNSHIERLPYCACSGGVTLRIPHIEKLRSCVCYDASVIHELCQGPDAWQEPGACQKPGACREPGKTESCRSPAMGGFEGYPVLVCQSVAAVNVLAHRKRVLTSRSTLNKQWPSRLLLYSRCLKFPPKAAAEVSLKTGYLVCLKASGERDVRSQTTIVPNGLILRCRCVFGTEDPYISHML